MKKFFAEFKKFITRGNVIDLAVGVIIGGAFTAIVNGVSNNVLKPIINFLLAKIFGDGAFEGAYTFLGDKVYTLDAEGKEVIDLAKCHYIDWGSLIIAIINFFVTALVLFLIVRAINRVKENDSSKLSKADKKAMKEMGLKPRSEADVATYRDALNKKAEEEKAAAQEAARLEREANPTTEDLLKKIVVLLESK